MKLLKISDILKLQQLRFYYKYKNNKLAHYLQALPFHPNTRTHDYDTHIKHNIDHPIAKHIFAKNFIRFGIPRIVNDCPNSILDKINTHSLHGFSGHIKTHFLQSYQENSTIVDCYVYAIIKFCISQFFLPTYDWHIIIIIFFLLCISHQNNTIFNYFLWYVNINLSQFTLREGGKCFNYLIMILYAVSSACFLVCLFLVFGPDAVKVAILKYIV